MYKKLYIIVKNYILYNMAIAKTLTPLLSFEYDG